MTTNETSFVRKPSRIFNTPIISTSVSPSTKQVNFRSNATTRSILIGVDVFNCIFQTLCCYLLIMIFRRSLRKKTQDLYVLNLAVSELFASIFLTARDVINLMRLFPENVRLGAIDRSFWIMNMFFVTAVQYIYILAMIFITCDRFFQIHFPFRYQSHWGIKKSWRLVIGTWVGCISIGATLSLLTHFYYMFIRYEAKISRIMAVNVLSGFYTASLVIAFVAYISIFTEYSKSTRNRSLNPKKKENEHVAKKLNEEQQSPSQRRGKLSSRHLSTISDNTFWLMKTFKTSKFHVPFLLIFTYLIFTVIPSITRSFRYLLGLKVPYEWTFFYLCSLRISYTVDGIIYVFLQRRVRRLLWRKMGGTNRTLDRSSSFRSSGHRVPVTETISTKC